jgi:L-fucose mutarotase
MLKGLDPLLTPDLLHTLALMGHGDVLALVDRNYPAHSTNERVIRLDGCDLPTAARAILSVLPIDYFIDQPVAGMAPVDDPDATPAVQREVVDLVVAAEGRQVGVERIERLAFYERVRSAFAVVLTTESRPYGCVLLTKGVVFD